MGSIKTIEEARKLPERNPIRYKEKVVDGQKVAIPYFAELVATELEDDDVIAFLDTDGKMKQIGYDDGGAYKYAI